MGVHGSADNLDIAERRVPSKVKRYRRRLRHIMGHDFSSGAPIRWLDVGAGYGEVIEAVESLAPPSSRVCGIEPMVPKAEAARAKGLDVRECFLDSIDERFNFISLINVFSHIYDFDAFLNSVRERLLPDGELILETGDMTGVHQRSLFPGELGLPDHVAFAGSWHLRAYLERNGFSIIAISRTRIDGCWYTAKTAAKKSLGRSVKLRVPYSSPYRSIMIRAHLSDRIDLIDGVVRQV
jgi:SAM-dependent methyltransferase